MPSFQPLSSSPLSGLIWEIDPTAGALFGDSPFNFVVTPPTPAPSLFGKRLASVFAFMRDTVWPDILDSLNTTQITVIVRTRYVSPTDPLATGWTEVTTDVYAAVMGPSIENIQRGLLTASDFECLIAARSLTAALTQADAIRIDGVNYDVVGVQAFPRVPLPVAYRFMLRRAV